MLPPMKCASFFRRPACARRVSRDQKQSRPIAAEVPRWPSLTRVAWRTKSPKRKGNSVAAVAQKTDRLNWKPPVAVPPESFAPEMTPIDSGNPAWTIPRAVIITALGVAQILSWGTSFYFVAVFASPIARETGWPYAWVVAGVSLGLVTAGFISPRVGREIGQRGGRPVLACGAILFA